MAKILKDALDRLTAAIDTLEESTVRSNLNELEKIGASARFCIAFELAQKTLRLVLADTFGRGDGVSASPKAFLRMALHEGLVADISIWFAFLESRNSFAHIDKQSTAELVLASAVRFPPQAWVLLAHLSRYVDEPQPHRARRNPQNHFDVRA